MELNNPFPHFPKRTIAITLCCGALLILTTSAYIYYKYGSRIHDIDCSEYPGILINRETALSHYLLCHHYTYSGSGTNYQADFNIKVLTGYRPPGKLARDVKYEWLRVPPYYFIVWEAGNNCRTKITAEILMSICKWNILDVHPTIHTKICNSDLLSRDEINIHKQLTGIIDVDDILVIYNVNTLSLLYTHPDAIHIPEEMGRIWNSGQSKYYKIGEPPLLLASDLNQGTTCPIEKQREFFTKKE